MRPTEVETVKKVIKKRREDPYNSYIKSSHVKRETGMSTQKAGKILIWLAENTDTLEKWNKTSSSANATYKII